MNLAASRSALLKNRIVMRLGCVLMAVGFLISSVVTPKAQAVAVVDDVAVGAMSCAAFLESIGLPLSATVTAGVPAAELLSGGVTAVAGEYAAATGAAASGEAFLGTVAAGTAVSAGTIVLTAAAVAACAALAYWLYDSYLAEASTTVPLYSYSYASSGFRFSTFIKAGKNGFKPTGTCIAYGSRVDLDNGSYISLEDNGSGTKCMLYFHGANNSQSYRTYTYRKNEDEDLSKGVWLMIHDGTVYVGTYNTINFYVCSSAGVPASFFDGVLQNESLSITNNNYQAAPEVQTNQSMALNVTSVPAGSSLSELVEVIPQQVADGTLSVEYQIETASPTQPTLPGSEGVEDVDDLGLPSLGDALTRRFPFSIPWDIARGITLLAAPAKAPYWEVDFLKPISGRVGGWQGSTKIVLDFSEFEILGRLSRWTSTIGFCLFLASATKRFIWTA